MGPKSVIVVAALVFFCGCGQQKINFQDTDLGYCEYAQETPAGSIEYIIHGNGLIFAKTEEKAAEIRLGKISSEAAELIIAETEKEFSGQGRGVDCRNCSVVHLFCESGGVTKAYSSRMEEAPEFFEKTRETMAAAAAEMAPVDQYFIHYVYQKPDEDIVDYHIYSDGTVLLEYFGEGNGELKDSKMLKISAEDVRRLRDMPDGGFYTSEDSLEGCAKSSFLWGYVEVLDDGRYGRVYTCGVGDSAADSVFRKMTEAIQ